MINSYRAAYAAASPYIAEVDIDKVYKQTIEVYEGLYEEYRTSDGSYVAGIPFIDVYKRQVEQRRKSVLVIRWL